MSSLTQLVLRRLGKRFLMVRWEISFFCLIMSFSEALSFYWWKRSVYSFWHCHRKEWQFWDKVNKAEGKGEEWRKAVLLTCVAWIKSSLKVGLFLFLLNTANYCPLFLKPFCGDILLLLNNLLVDRLFQNLKLFCVLLSVVPYFSVDFCPIL